MAPRLDKIGVNSTWSRCSYSWALNRAFTGVECFNIAILELKRPPPPAEAEEFARENIAVIC